MKTEISSYEKQAIDFLQLTGTTFSAKFLRFGKHFDDDKDERDIYEITLQRGARKYVFNFGQSIAKSGAFIVKDKNPRLTRLFAQKSDGYFYANKIGNILGVRTNPEQQAPTAYDVLTCLQKYEVGTFENFCSEFGYETDSRKAEKIYNEVKDEFMNVSTLFNDDEMQRLQEIN